MHKVFILTHSSNNYFLGVFNKYVDATKYMRKHFKDMSKNNYQQYIINEVYSDKISSLDKPKGIFYIWGSKEGVLDSKPLKLVPEASLYIEEPLEDYLNGDSEFLKKVTNLLKPFKGYRGGGGTGGKTYDHSFYVPLEFWDEAKAALEENKIKFIKGNLINPFAY